MVEILKTAYDNGNFKLIHRIKNFESDGFDWEGSIKSG
jgi:hypothetical protein